MRETGAEPDRAPGRGPAPLVAVPMANNPEVAGAIAAALSEGIARFVLIGPPYDVAGMLAVHGVSRTLLEGAAPDDPSGPERPSGGAATDGAAAAGAPPAGAATPVRLLPEDDPRRACERAAELAAAGEVQALMKGLVQTADFVRAVLARGLVAPGGLLSHVARVDVPGFDRPILLTDAAITTFPDAAQKRVLVENALAAAAVFGITRPRVAMVAPAEKVSEKVPSTTDAAAVVAGFAGDDRLEIDGPFGLDVAISPQAAAVKGIGGPVAGRADVLVLPSIDAANILYKALTGFAHARVAGIVAGASVPIVLTSRADSEESKLASLRFALAATGPR